MNLNIILNNNTKSKSVSKNKLIIISISIFKNLEPQSISSNNLI